MESAVEADGLFVRPGQEPVRVTNLSQCLDNGGPDSAPANQGASRGSDLGLGHNSAVVWIVAHCLGQPAGGWRRFRPPAPLRSLFASEGR